MAYCVASETDKAILIYPSLPQQEILNEKDYWISLDKLSLKTDDSSKKGEGAGRIVHISARSIQILSKEGNKILHRLLDNDRNTIEQLLIEP